jgi:hypothetical protein
MTAMEHREVERRVQEALQAFHHSDQSDEAE